MTATTRDGSHLIDPSRDLLKTLENCEGHYVCPVDDDGNLLGPVVGYTAQYEPGKNWVGLVYFNFAKADAWSAVLTFFAEAIVDRMADWGLDPGVIVDAPWAGVKISQEVARLLGCRHIFAEKKGDDLSLGRYEGEIRPGDKVMIGEELVNNTSTTAKLIQLIHDAGGDVLGITCAINRSFPHKGSIGIGGRSYPIVGAVEVPTPQYRQDDLMVARSIVADNVVWKPKYEWDRMKAAMDAHR